MSQSFSDTEVLCVEVRPPGLLHCRRLHHPLHRHHPPQGRASPGCSAPSLPFLGLAVTPGWSAEVILWKMTGPVLGRCFFRMVSDGRTISPTFLPRLQIQNFPGFSSVNFRLRRPTKPHSAGPPPPGSALNLPTSAKRKRSLVAGQTIPSRQNEAVRNVFLFFSPLAW